MGRRIVLVVAAVAVAASAAGHAAPAFRLSSPAFKAGARIPERFTCLGDNLSPPLRWTAPPARTRSFALELHDPDAPLAGGFTHWLGWGFRATARGIATDRHAPVEGANGGGAPGYTGPCPPSGVHRYRFTVYALDAPLRLRAGADRAAFQRALRGHVLARAVLVGRFGT
jgi:Raf kinase inhibitor-like YbhB/YbcL family protein